MGEKIIREQIGFNPEKHLEGIKSTLPKGLLERSKGDVIKACREVNRQLWESTNEHKLSGQSRICSSFKVHKRG